MFLIWFLRPQHDVISDGKGFHAHGHSKRGWSLFPVHPIDDHFWCDHQAVSSPRRSVWGSQKLQKLASHANVGFQLTLNSPLTFTIVTRKRFGLDSPISFIRWLLMMLRNTNKSLKSVKVLKFFKKLRISCNQSNQKSTPGAFLPY